MIQLGALYTTNESLMDDIRVRKLEDWVVGWFRSQAKQHGRSLEGELRETLTETTMRRKKEIAAELRADLQELEGKYGRFPGSAKIIREMRDMRG
jgi:plasmid stability protein